MCYVGGYVSEGVRARHGLRHERKSALDIFTVGVQPAAGTGSMSSRDYLSPINHRRSPPPPEHPLPKDATANYTFPRPSALLDSNSSAVDPQRSLQKDASPITALSMLR